MVETIAAVWQLLPTYEVNEGVQITRPLRYTEMTPHEQLLVMFRECR